jgi:hypothetical protein
MSAASRQKHTRWHLLLATGLSTLSLLGLAGSQIKASNTQAERDQMLARSRQLEQRLQQTKDEKREISQRLATWQQIQAAGWSRPENRSAWAESLLALHQELNLPALGYEFRPQSLFPDQDESPQKWLSSPLHLHLELLHEGDLIQLLTRLPAVIPARIIARQCHIWRQKTAGLAADCEFELITLSPAASPAP